MIRVVVADPLNPLAEIKMIDPSSIGKEVKGWIQIVQMRGEGDVFNLWMNEEGKLQGLNPNFLIFGGHDILLGNAVISKSDNEGEEIGLTEEEAGFWLNRVAEVKKNDSPLF